MMLPAKPWRLDGYLQRAVLVEANFGDYALDNTSNKEGQCGRAYLALAISGDVLLSGSGSSFWPGPPSVAWPTAVLEAPGA